MKLIDELKIAKQISVVWREIRYGYLMVWMIGWMFTCGYTDFLAETVAGKVWFGLVSIGLWPMFLGHALR